MILILWLSLLALSFGICLLGYFTDDEPYLTVGLTFLFLLAIVIITNTLQNETGTATVTNYTYSGANITSTIATVTYTQTAWNDTTSHIVGYLLATLSGIGIALSLMTRRNKKKAEGMEE